MSKVMENKERKTMTKAATEMTEIERKIQFHLLGFYLTRLVLLRRKKTLLNETYPRKYKNYRQT